MGERGERGVEGGGDECLGFLVGGFGLEVVENSFLFRREFVEGMLLGEEEEAGEGERIGRRTGGEEEVFFALFFVSGVSVALFLFFLSVKSIFVCHTNPRREKDFCGENTQQEERDKFKTKNGVSEANGPQKCPVDEG